MYASSDVNIMMMFFELFLIYFFLHNNTVLPILPHNFMVFVCFICRTGFKKCTKLLLDYGADSQMRMVGGWTAAHCAAEGGHLEVLKIFIEHGCPTYLTDDSGDTPANVAEIYSHERCKKLLDDFVKKTKFKSTQLNKY